MKPAYRILDIGFNVAVAHLAEKTARGFRVADIAPHAAHRCSDFDYQSCKARRCPSSTAYRPDRAKAIQEAGRLQ